MDPSSSTSSQDGASNTTIQVCGPRGYPKLAAIMGPHRGMALFKRFAALNARNLLYMQAELLDLERELDVIAEMDREDGRPFDVKALKLMSPDPGEPDDEQRQLVLKLQRKLKEYNEALLQQAKINKLEKANKYDLHVLNGWLRQEQGGDNFLLGVEARPWQEQRDLVALSSRQHDTLTKYMSETLVPWLHRQGLHRPKKMDEEAGLVEWDDGSYSTASRVLSVVASSLIPGAAVVTLYHIQDLLARIFAALGFSALFSLALALLTTARPAEIFAATAAFASVQVVFIGSTSTS